MTLLPGAAARAFALAPSSPRTPTRYRSTAAVGTGASLARDAPTPARRHPALVPARARPPGRARVGPRSTGSSLDVEMLDNVFAPRIVRIPVGGTVEWTNEGRSPHNVTADDGAFASADLAPGEVFDETFATEGAYPYFCSIHGSPGAGMTGLVLVGDAPIPGARVGRRTGSRDAALAPRRRDPCAAGRADDPGRGGRGRARRHRRDLARRLRGGGGRDDAVPDDPRARPQPGDPGGRVHARQRDRGDRGRRRDDREHDRPPLRRERVPVVERVRLPRVVPDGVQRRGLRAVRVRLPSTGSSTTRTRAGIPTRASTSASAPRATP